MWSELIVKERSIPVVVLSCKNETKVTKVLLAVICHSDTTANFISFAKFHFFFPTDLVKWPKCDDTV